MYGHPNLMRAWAAQMKPKGRPGRPPKRGSRAWMLRRQAELPFDGAGGFRSGSVVTPGLTPTGWNSR